MSEFVIESPAQEPAMVSYVTRQSALGILGFGFLYISTPVGGSRSWVSFELQDFCSSMPMPATELMMVSSVATKTQFESISGKHDLVLN